MKYLALTLCLAASVALSACNTTNQYGSGANFATGRTAGEQATEVSSAVNNTYKKAATKVERVFQSSLSK